jgi:hypothetical protein
MNILNTYVKHPAHKYRLSYYVLVCVYLLLQSCGGGGSTESTAPSNPSKPNNPINQPPVVTGVLEVDCSGSNCAALTASQYAGTGVGVWEHNNTSKQDALINVDISGVKAGNTVTLAFTNGTASNAFSLPSFGNSVFSDSQIKPNLTTAFKSIKAEQHEHLNKLHAHDEAHSVMMHRNQAAKQLLVKKTAATPSTAQRADIKLETLAPTPAVNSQRVWRDNYPQVPVEYTTTNKHVCTLPGGRNVVFWKDNKDTNVTSSTLEYFVNNTCGASGTFARLNELLGDFWGPNSQYGKVIEDSPNQKQDVNIVFLRAEASAPWAGYFYNGNNYLSTSKADSNQALVFFVNSTEIDEDESFYLSTLVHEAAHMIAFYQNSILRDKKWDEEWLDEVFAMMGEDIVIPAVANYNKIAEDRLPRYLVSGAGISLAKWSIVDNPSEHYNMGAALAAFLNRRYGLNVYQQLLTSCASAELKNDEYACLNQVIVQNGGVSLADELAKMGASVFSKASATTGLPGYGFPQVSSGGYLLQAIDLSNLYISKPASVSSYPAMFQTYLNDEIPKDTLTTRYSRYSVRVPPSTRLHVVVK